MQLLVLVKGMGQLVHSLMGEEGKKERPGLRKSCQAAGGPCCLARTAWRPNAVACPATPSSFISHRKAKSTELPVRNHYSSLPFKLLPWMLS